MLKTLLLFEKDKLLRSSKLVIPLLLLVAYIGMAYAYAPLDILDSYSICSLVVFLLMISIGVMYDDINYQTIDQTVLVKLPYKVYLYLGKAIAIAVISFVVSLVCVFTPLLIHVCKGLQLFNRGVVFTDIYSGIILFWLIGLSGGISGFLTNHRIISNRKTAIILSALFALTVIVKGAMVKKVIALRFIMWILPPVYDLSVAYSKNVYFSFNHTWLYFLWMIAYVIVESAAYLWIMHRKRFE